MLTDDSRLAEQVEAAGWADLMRTCPASLAQGLGLSIHQEADAITSVAARVPPPIFNRSCGWRTEEEWTVALERHRQSGAAEYFMQPRPDAGPSFGEWAGAQGLVHRSRWAKMIRDCTTPPKTETSLTVTEAGARHADAFAAVVLGGFGMPPLLAPWLVALASRSGWRSYIGWDADRPVTAAALRIDGNTAWCGLGATLPDHRGRGGQSALFERRIADASAAGCRVLVTETGEDTDAAPNPSYRNMVRAGFRLAHFRDNWGPPVHSG